ncbi:hypothetical protein QD47_23370 [Paenibacillus terrae]|uniref:Uncharacterized protein n=1 Tax=Paenibacillus terrae TaxID=159743 RepID=A0A0D7WZY7_9BACL|nr:hypothetical protein QD47_23370 [Paenibacillus terrae]
MIYQKPMELFQTITQPGLVLHHNEFMTLWKILGLTSLEGCVDCKRTEFHQHLQRISPKMEENICTRQKIEDLLSGNVCGLWVCQTLMSSQKKCY